MQHVSFHPIKGRSKEIIDFLMTRQEITVHPLLLYEVRLSCEEVIVNIINYAYPEGEEGYLSLRIESNTDKLQIEFRDGGKPFNPLQTDMPNINFLPEEREPGGLGIFLVKQLMDSVDYRYINKENCLILTKNIE